MGNLSYDFIILVIYFLVYLLFHNHVRYFYDYYVDVYVAVILPRNTCVRENWMMCGINYSAFELFTLAHFPMKTKYTNLH